MMSSQWCFVPAFPLPSAGVAPRASVAAGAGPHGVSTSGSKPRLVFLMLKNVEKADFPSSLDKVAQ